MNIDMINAAQARLNGRARLTPMLSSPFLDEIAGRRVLIKGECLQHTGSFKFRGAWSAISALDKDAGTRGVIAYSSGNHAQGIALAAAKHGFPAVIIMPGDAPMQKIENTRILGAEVVLYERENEDRDEIGNRLAAKRGLTLIKPFDNELVIAGQGTVGLEIADHANAEGIKNAEVLVPCGGGGLTSGIALALADRAPEMTARPVEPAGFDDTARSLLSGQIERNLRQSGSICDAILTPAPGKITFPIMHRLCGPGLSVSDDDCLHAMALAFNFLKIVIEPGGAVALAAALFQPEAVQGDAVIVVASGGNVGHEMFSRALTLYG